MSKLTDLFPKEAKFTLDDMDGEFTLKKYSIRTEVWIESAFGGSLEFIELLKSGKIIALSQFAWNQLKEKEKFAGLEAFQESICSSRDVQGLTKAIMQCYGYGQPQIDEAAKRPVGELLPPPIGRESATASATSTGTPSINF